MSRDHELFKMAALLHSIASNPADEAYWRGYSIGIARRRAGGASQDDLEAVAFDLLTDAPDGIAQLLGRGYRNGLDGKTIELQMPTQTDLRSLPYNEL